MRTAVKALNEAMPVVRMKDRFTDVIASGYRDINMNVRMPSGHIGEVQLHMEAMLDAKKNMGGHDIYEEIRTIFANAWKVNAPLTEAEFNRVEELTKQSRDLYDYVLARAQTGGRRARING